MPFQPPFCLFSYFQANITIFTTNICGKCPSSKRCWDWNPRPSVHESPPITTRPGLPPKVNAVHSQNNFKLVSLPLSLLGQSCCLPHSTEISGWLVAIYRLELCRPLSLYICHSGASSVNLISSYFSANRP